MAREPMESKQDLSLLDSAERTGFKSEREHSRPEGVDGGFYFVAFAVLLSFLLWLALKLFQSL
jgi:hypothetical protein